MGRRAEGLRPAWGSPWRRIPWQAVLLAASILSSGFLLTHAVDREITVTVDPSQKVPIGQDVTLTPGGEADFSSCIWYRGTGDPETRIFSYRPSPPAQFNGPAFTERETGGPGCSLHIRNVALSDNGTFTVIKTMSNFDNEIGRVQLEVLERVSNITITSSPEKAIENQTTVLSCSSVVTGVSYYWSKGNQPLVSGAHLTFSPTNRSDSDNYTCYGNNSFSHASAVFPLNVFYGPDEPVIRPPGHDYANGSSLTLSCHADSYMPAQYTWYYNGSELRKDPSLPIPSLSFDQAGNYTCVANNNVTGIVRSIHWEINVLAADPGDSGGGLSAGAIVGIVIGCLVGVVLIVAVLYVACKGSPFGRTKERSSNGNIPSAPGRNQGVTDTKPMSGEENLQYSTLVFHSASPSQPGPQPASPSDGGTVYVEIKKK